MEWVYFKEIIFAQASVNNLLTSLFWILIFNFISELISKTFQLLKFRNCLVMGCLSNSLKLLSHEVSLVFNSLIPETWRSLPKFINIGPIFHNQHRENNSSLCFFCFESFLASNTLWDNPIWLLTRIAISCLVCYWFHQLCSRCGIGSTSFV